VWVGEGEVDGGGSMSTREGGPSIDPRGIKEGEAQV